MNQKMIIGCVEKVSLPTVSKEVFRARIDTGAKSSSLWATNIKENPHGLIATINGVEKMFGHYSRVKVASSMGHEQIRYKVKLPIIIKKRRIVATFTLADRSKQVYPILIGRTTLNKKFIVDVSRGSPLREEEQKRSDKLQSTVQEEKI